MKLALIGVAVMAGWWSFASVTVATGTHDPPAEVVIAVRRHVSLPHQQWTLRMMACESGFDPLARNGSHYGLAQHARRYLPDRIRRYAPDGTVEQFIAGDIDLQVRVTEGLRADFGRGPWDESRWCWD